MDDQVDALRCCNGVDEEGEVFVLCCVAVIFLKSVEFKMRKSCVICDEVDDEKLEGLTWTIKN